MGLIERKPSQEELKMLLAYLSQSVTSLDTILHSLNNIIESRDDTFNVKERVDLKLELSRIEKLLEPAIKQNNVTIRYALQVENLFTIRAYIQNILSQLIANSIQFRSPDRRPEINVLAMRENGHIIIHVEDNGLGIDLHRFKEDMFKPFKRFHASSGGKGIGLYLVKLQVEKLQGTVNVISKPEKGFRITIQLSDDAYRLN
jgi:signal transduction histidine kinase